MDKREEEAKVTVRIPKEKYSALRMKLLRAGKTVSAWFREAVDFYLGEVK